jgi:hypothetical protein
VEFQRKRRQRILKNTELGKKAERFLYGRKQYSNVQYLTRYGGPAVKGGGLGTQGEQNGFDRAMMMGGGGQVRGTPAVYIGLEYDSALCTFPTPPSYVMGIEKYLRAE